MGFRQVYIRTCLSFGGLTFYRVQCWVFSLGVSMPPAPIVCMSICVQCNCTAYNTKLCHFFTFQGFQATISAPHMVRRIKSNQLVLCKCIQFPCIYITVCLQMNLFLPETGCRAD